MSLPIRPGKAVVGKCYEDESGFYLGAYLKMGSRPRDPLDSGAGQTLSPVYVFENRSIEDTYPMPKVKEVPCKTAGRRKSKKAGRRTRKRRV
jgi:hypothetical protein